MEKYTSFYDWELAINGRKNRKRKLGSSTKKEKREKLFDDITEEEFRETVKKWREKNNLELE
jgi:hypothetical protein